jgi:glycosyltransferase involved in cell wall biosynthesis
MPVHQLLPSFKYGDAMGHAAVGFRALLRRLGHAGDVFAAEVERGWTSLVRPARELKVQPGDVVLYHHGIASQLANEVLHLPCKKGLVFHNVTPARFYSPGTPLHEALLHGRAQMAGMARLVDVAIGVSPHNVAELTAAGHANVHCVPLYVEPERFDVDHADHGYSLELRGGHPHVVSVSRVVPHKRVEDLLSLHQELLRIAPEARLTVVGAYAGGNTAFRALKQRARALRGVRFTGKISHAELVAAYRSADVYVSMSEHEGFGVPLVEAMASDVPVLAFGAAAVPETLGGAGLVFDEKHFAALAELVKLIAHDPDLRQKLVDGQRERVAALSPQATLTALQGALDSMGVPRPAWRKAKKGRAKVAVVVQRFGETIVGGAESHARQVALRLAEAADVSVFTTCAKDHLTWDNDLPAGLGSDGPLKVHRFPTRAPRAMTAFNRLSDVRLNEANDLTGEEHWLAEQGPQVPGLLEHLERVRHDFDAFLFFTYLYAPTAWGVPLLADRALVIPTAHDEPPLRFDAFADVFERPAALLCNTPEEVSLIQNRFARAVRTRVVGVGIDPPPVQPLRFRKKHGLSGDYLLYVGRLEAGKGLGMLLKHHRRLVKKDPDAPWLLLAGAGEVDLAGPKVKQLGRIDEQDKWDGLAGALAAVVPSRFESLSLLALEAFAVGTPIIGNAESEVVSGHVRRSGAGASWTSPEEFFDAVDAVRDARASMSRLASRYAANFRWDKVMAAYAEEIEALRKGA